MRPPTATHSQRRPPPAVILAFPSEGPFSFSADGESGHHPKASKRTEGTMSTKKPKTGSRTRSKKRRAAEPAPFSTPALVPKPALGAPKLGAALDPGTSRSAGREPHRRRRSFKPRRRKDAPPGRPVLCRDYPTPRSPRRKAWTNCLRKATPLKRRPSLESKTLLTPTRAR